jgi:CBS-domain-containing membrane protein
MDAPDIMSKDVLTLSPDTSIREALDALLHYRIWSSIRVGRP